ncbi:Peroxidase superfamily protein [Raphanus sativus]|nr:Peroxidase superfamily protein [Raphanus sativus]
MFYSSPNNTYTLTTPNEGKLRPGFYKEECASAEEIVRGVVEGSVARNPRNAAVLLRLQFHDCFVGGCDASILIKRDGEEDEGSAVGNAGVGGFEIIDEAKSATEKARGPYYEVPTGRRDGLTAEKSKAANLPDPQESIETLKSKFREKGLSEKDLVVLSAGAHTIGTVACFFVTQRLDSEDPTLDPAFFKMLRSTCPQGGDVNVRLPLDLGSSLTFDWHIFHNIKKGRGVIQSDAALYQDRDTKKIIDSFLTFKDHFFPEFTKSMVKMGSIGVKVGVEGEIRHQCNTTN